MLICLYFGMIWSSRHLLSSKDVRVICAVADGRSASVAADRLHMSQPALSRILNGLEARLKVALFQRGWSGTEPTAMGEVVIGQCRRILNDIEHVERDHLQQHGARLRLSLHVRWRHLMSVAAIVRTGSASAAAMKLGVRQPAISQAIGEISGYLRQELFVRRHDGLSPLPTAYVLAALCDRIHNELANLPSLMKQAGSGLSGRIAIGMLPFSGQDLVMRTFGKLTRSHPRLRLVAVPGSYNSLAEALQRREIDLIVGILRNPAPFKNFREERLYDEQFALVARRDHPCHSRPIGIEVLAELNWIVAPHGTPVRSFFEAMFREFGREPPAQSCEILSFANAEQMIIESESIALLSYSKAGLAKLRSELRRVDFTLPRSRIPIGLTSLGGYKSNPPVASFVDLLKTTMKLAGLRA